ncbi:hypothetical protein EJB05_52252 [Eragrostis curvula]|uniref:Uncharacterized protein n=1 Tax=Eragrostis curvula TaxID=38414 RepID=A0A5J9STK1_9POAL|nr:hypothetical protein EJB05_52252 [Eragrostis curvula]
MDSAASDSQINLALLLFLIFPCHHFLTLVWVRHQFLHLTLRQARIPFGLTGRLRFALGRFILRRLRLRALLLRSRLLRRLDDEPHCRGGGGGARKGASTR